MWSPIFSKIVDSSLWSEPDHVCKVFITLLATKDCDHVSRLTAYAIGQKCWPGNAEAERTALDALRILAEPDTRRIEPQPHEGRRIERVEHGWKILNGQYYEDMMRQIKRREYKRTWQANKRGTPSPGETTAVKAYGDGDDRGFDAITNEANGL
ncbi:MAG TPA: hypothetical protein VF077_13090 [Nitrospiraceae bacterium]